MPKPIKRKISRHDTGAEETVRTFMSVATEKIENNFRQVVIGAAIVLAVLIAVAVAFFAAGSAGDKAERAFYEGYKAYYGLYDAKAMTQFERYERSLASFKQSYETKGSPHALLYMAYSQNQLGQLDEALASLRELESKFSNEDYYVALALYKRAAIQLKAGRTEEALDALSTLASRNSDIYRDLALVDSARVLDSLGKKEEALEKYRTILAEFPESPSSSEASIKTGAGEPADRGDKEVEEGK